MKERFFITLISLLQVYLLLPAATTYAQANSIVGHWEGAYVRMGAVQTIMMDFTMRQGNLFQTFYRSISVMVKVKNKSKIMLYRINKLIFALLILTIIGNAQVSKPDIAKDFEEKEVTYLSGEIKLAATLLTPKGSGPFPAVVVIHGSGTSTRSNAWTSAYADALVKRGVAVLHPDKRGSGKSAGNWLTASFLDLADDAIAGVELLRKDPRIDKSRIGVIGFSQGGHIAPAAATRSSSVAFVISVSASVVPMMEQIMDEVEMAAERAGLSKQQIDIVNDVNRKAIDAALSGESPQEYLDALAAAKSGPLKGNPVIEKFPTDPDHPSRTFVSSIGNFDPIPYWTKTTVPILFVYGGADTQIRIRKSIDRIDDTLGKAGRNYTLLLFRKNGHGIFREDLLDLMARWISNKGVD